MPIIGIRDFKNRACEIVRRVREEGELYIVTSHGRPAAIMFPVQDGEIEEMIIRYHPYLKNRRGASPKKPSEGK